MLPKVGKTQTPKFRQYYFFAKSLENVQISDWLSNINVVIFVFDNLIEWLKEV